MSKRWKKQEKEPTIRTKELLVQALVDLIIGSILIFLEKIMD